MAVANDLHGGKHRKDNYVQPFNGISLRICTLFVVNIVAYLTNGCDAMKKNVFFFCCSDDRSSL